MDHILVIRELIGRDVAGRGVDELRNAVYERCAGKLDRCRLINDAGRVRLAVKRPHVFVELIGIEYLADALGDEGDALLGLCRNDGAHTGSVAGLDDHAESFGLEILLIDAGDAFLRL